MKIWGMSDLHLEFDPSRILEIPEADVCVVAGDIQIKGIIRSLEWLQKHIAPKMPVVFVPGNHEFYRASMVEARSAAHEAVSTMSNIHLLDDGFVEIDDVLFVGSTLWTDLKLQGNPDLIAHLARNSDQKMYDYKEITYQKKPWIRFTPQRTAALHRTGKAFIREALAGRKDKAVVVSHHAPSSRSLASDNQNDLFSSMYASDLEEMILELKPNIWFHGHIHTSSDYWLGETRVICNPFGYPGKEENPSFNPNLIAEL